MIVSFYFLPLGLFSVILSVHNLQFVVFAVKRRANALRLRPGRVVSLGPVRSQLKVLLLPQQASQDFLRIQEEVPVALQVLRLHDARHQGLLDGRGLTGPMPDAVTDFPLRLDDQQTRLAETRRC